MAEEKTPAELKAAELKAAEEKAAKEAEEKAAQEAEEKAAQEANKKFDMFAPGHHLTMKIPTSEKRLFIHKAELCNVPSRLGKGPCTVLKAFAMPNGDLALKGDTFDPVVERFSFGKLESLHGRKFFECDKKKLQGIATKLLETEKKK